MARVTPFLWMNGGLAEAVQCYSELFDDAEVIDFTPLPPGAPGPQGELMSATVRLVGQELILLNGGSHYSLTPAFSLMVNCVDQDEIDHLWDALSEGGEEMQCGWVTDRFGMTWQIVPENIGELLGDPDPMRAMRATEALLGMNKIDIAAIQAAADAG